MTQKGIFDELYIIFMVHKWITKIDSIHMIMDDISDFSAFLRKISD